MRFTCAVCIAILLPLPAFATPPEKLYYVGEVKLSGPDGKPMGSQVILLEKSSDKDKSTITERAIVVKPDGKVDEEVMLLTVKQDNAFTIGDAAKTVEGTGTLFGPAWKWTYLKGTFKHKNGVVIEDENFMTDPSAVTARKKISAPNGKVYMYMEMTLTSITPTTFEILVAGLKKPARAHRKPERLGHRVQRLRW